MRRARTVGALAAVVTTIACADVSCTLIGCLSGLSVGVEGNPQGPYTVEIVGPQSSATYQFMCGAGQTCAPFFDNYTGTSPLVRVTKGGVVKETQLSNVVYTHSWPNGKSCGPECVQGSVTVPAP